MYDRMSIICYGREGSHYHAKTLAMGFDIVAGGAGEQHRLLYLHL